MAKLLGLGLLVVLVAAAVCFWTAEESHGSSVRDYDAIVKDGTLRVTTEYNSSGYFVDGDSLAGFQYDMVKAFADAHQLKVEFLPEMSLQVRLDGIREGKFDLIACNILRINQKIEEISLSDPIVRSKQVLVQRGLEYLSDSSLYVKSQLDLAGKTVYVVKDDPSIMRIHNLGSEIGDTIYVIEHDKYGPEQLISMVAHGDIDYFVCSDKIANAVIDSFPQLSELTDIGFTQLYSWGVHEKAVQLLDSLNIWLDAFKQTEEYRQIYTKYYGHR